MRLDGQIIQLIHSHKNTVFSVKRRKMLAHFNYHAIAMCTVDRLLAIYVVSTCQSCLLDA